MEAFYGLPEKVEFCKRCVISNQRPNSTVEFQSQKNQHKYTIELDHEGICSACRYHEQKVVGINWDQRERDLCSLLDRFRRSDGGHDVVVPGSGGKDSAYTAHTLKYKYGMNPLTVTWAPHLYTDIGWRNFQNWMHVGGLDNILYTPNGILHRYLTRQAFVNLLHPFQPFIVGQRIIGPRMAKKFGIPLVMYGENQAEYGNKIDENKNPLMDAKFYSAPKLDEIILGGGSLPQIIKETDFTLNDFEPYIPESAGALAEAGVEVHYLGYYKYWDPQECYYYASENTGFIANDQRTEGSYSKYSSIDDKIDPFHYYTTLIKFGLGRASYDAAQEIRNEKISRSEGVALVKKFDLEFPTRFFSEFLDYISVSEEEFRRTVDAFRSPHLWSLNSGEWSLRRPIWDCKE